MQLKRYKFIYCDKYNREIKTEIHFCYSKIDATKKAFILMENNTNVRVHFIRTLVIADLTILPFRSVFF